ncbi:MAG: SPOR domain-containing protein [Gammaproteobacteria bacterium]|nr:SPOR domain-containing protein [Gammaproteobacteria bacterium]
MPTDYKNRNQNHEKKSIPGYVWLAAGLGIGLFVALIIYLDKQPEVDSDFGATIQKELKKINPADDVATEEQADEEANERPEPKFNFYTILPELELLIPESETRPPKNRQPESTSGSQPKSQPESNKQYVLQAGSFQNKKDAEKLKATLALLGFQAHIQRVTVNNTAWHRVRIGPYSQSADLYDKIDLLRQNDINALPMELKPE